MARKTHHKHSSSKGYRRLLDGLAALDGVHRVATRRASPAWAQDARWRRSRRSAAPSRECRSPSTPRGAIVDAYLVTDRPEEVAAAIAARGWSVPSGDA